MSRLRQLQHLLEMQGAILDSGVGAFLALRMPPLSGLAEWCSSGSRIRSAERLFGRPASHPSMVVACRRQADPAGGLIHGGLCTPDARIIGGRTRAFFEMMSLVSVSIELSEGRQTDDAYVQSYVEHYPARFTRQRLIGSREEEEEEEQREEAARESSAGRRILTVTGHPGRLGNWMFRVATGIAMSLNSGRRLALAETLPCRVHEEGKPEPPECTFYSSFLHAIPRVPDLASIGEAALVLEPSFGYSPSVEEQVAAVPTGANIALFGFFQSYRYFGHRRQEVLEALRLPARYEGEALRRLQRLQWRVPVEQQPGTAAPLKSTDPTKICVAFGSGDAPRQAPLK